jgi:hypothetical protein
MSIVRGTRHYARIRDAAQFDDTETPVGTTTLKAYATNPLRIGRQPANCGALFVIGPLASPL